MLSEEILVDGDDKLHTSSEYHNGCFDCKELNAVEPDSIELKCKTSGDVINSSVQWFHKGNSIDQFDHAQVRTEGNDHTLLISNPRPSHTGFYSCNASTESGKNARNFVMVRIGPDYHARTNCIKYPCEHHGVCLVHHDEDSYCRCFGDYRGQNCQMYEPTRVIGVEQFNTTIGVMASVIFVVLISFLVTLACLYQKRRSSKRKRYMEQKTEYTRSFIVQSPIPTRLEELRSVRSHTNSPISMTIVECPRCREHFSPESGTVTQFDFVQPDDGAPIGNHVPRTRLLAYNESATIKQQSRYNSNDSSGHSSMFEDALADVENN